MKKLMIIMANDSSIRNQLNVVSYKKKVIKNIILKIDIFSF